MDGPIGLWELVEPAFLLLSSIIYVQPTFLRFFQYFWMIYFSKLHMLPDFFFQKFWED